MYLCGDSQVSTDAISQRHSDIDTVVQGAAQKHQSLLMLVTAQTHHNSCALAASPMREHIGILPSLSQLYSNLKVTA